MRKALLKLIIKKINQKITNNFDSIAYTFL